MVATENLRSVIVVFTNVFVYTVRNETSYLFEVAMCNTWHLFLCLE